MNSSRGSCRLRPMSILGLSVSGIVRGKAFVGFPLGLGISHLIGEIQP